MRLILAMLLAASALAQNVEILKSGSTSSLRGISVVDQRTIWVSGTEGTVLRSVDGGATWNNVSPNPIMAKDLDFRDVEAFDAQTAFVLASGAGTKARVFKTVDGGKSWSQQYLKFDPKVFLDCFAFWDRDHGIAIGDPIGHHFVLLETNDGEHWNVVSTLPEILPDEAAFSTGTCIVTSGDDDIWFGTGSKNGSRVFHSVDRGRTWTTVVTPVSSDVPGTGIFAMAFADTQIGAIVGGNYQKPEEVRVNAALTVNGGKTWSKTAAQPPGYRCGVAFMPETGGSSLLVVGTNGVDFTQDRGAHWRSLSPERYHSVAFTPDGSAAYILGMNGRIARISFKPNSNRR